MAQLPTTSKGWIYFASRQHSRSAGLYALSTKAALAIWYVAGRAWSNKGEVQTRVLFELDLLLSMPLLQLDALTVKRYCCMITEWSKQTCSSQESYNIDVADAAQGLLILTDVM